MPRVANTPAIPSEGWGVLHLVFEIAGSRNEPVAVAEAQALVDAFIEEQDAQLIAFRGICYDFSRSFTENIDATIASFFSIDLDAFRFLQRMMIAT